MGHLAGVAGGHLRVRGPGVWRFLHPIQVELIWGLVALAGAVVAFIAVGAWCERLEKRAADLRNARVHSYLRSLRYVDGKWITEGAEANGEGDRGGGAGHLCAGGGAGQHRPAATVKQILLLLALYTSVALVLAVFVAVTGGVSP